MANIDQCQRCIHCKQVVFDSDSMPDKISCEFNKDERKLTNEYCAAQDWGEKKDRYNSFVKTAKNISKVAFP